MSNLTCYARELGNCSLKINREHAISHKLLKHIYSDGEMIVGGFPWQGGKERLLSPNDLTARVLCETHNNMLSPLDDCGSRFMLGLSDVNDHFKKFNGRAPHPKIHFFNGHDLERWIMKVMMGIVTSGNAALENQTLPRTYPTLNELSILIGQQHSPPRGGLYLTNGIGERVMKETSFRFAPIVSMHLDTLVATGCICSFNGLQFAFSLAAPTTYDANGIFAKSIYRPSSIEFIDSSNDNKVQFYFTWDPKGDDKGIVVNYSSDKP